MSLVPLEDFKAYIRELTNDLDDVLQMALNSAGAEARHFLGFDPAAEFGSDGLPSDLNMAVMLLAQVHADAGDTATNESRRAAAQRLMVPYRHNTGIGAVA